MQSHTLTSTIVYSILGRLSPTSGSRRGLSVAPVLLFTIIFAIAGAAVQANAAAARHPAPDPTSCVDAIKASEAAHKIAPRLLLAIGMVESGRVDPATGHVAPWPWTINVGGTGYFFDSKAAAIIAVQAAQAAGVQSIDVGCMQINLLHHPNAFATLDEAFEPRTNAQYGGHFLRQLQGLLGSWPAAAAAYHSMTPELGMAYVTKVAVFWPEAAPFTLKATSQSIVDPLAQIDPHHVLTPEFRQHLAQDNDDRVARYVAMGLLPRVAALHPAAVHLAPATHPLPARQLQASLRAAPTNAWR